MGIFLNGTALSVKKYECQQHLRTQFSTQETCHLGLENCLRHSSFEKQCRGKMVSNEIFKTSLGNSIESFGNGSNQQLSISKNETMVAHSDMTNSSTDYFIGTVSIYQVPVSVKRRLRTIVVTIKIRT